MRCHMGNRRNSARFGYVHSTIRVRRGGVRATDQLRVSRALRRRRGNGLTRVDCRQRLCCCAYRRRSSGRGFSFGRDVRTSCHTQVAVTLRSLAVDRTTDRPANGFTAFMSGAVGTEDCHNVVTSRVRYWRPVWDDDGRSAQVSLGHWDNKQHVGTRSHGL